MRGMFFFILTSELSPAMFRYMCSGRNSEVGLVDALTPLASSNHFRPCLITRRINWVAFHLKEGYVLTMDKDHDDEARSGLNGRV